MFDIQISPSFLIIDLYYIGMYTVATSIPHFFVDLYNDVDLYNHYFVVCMSNSTVHVPVVTEDGAVRVVHFGDAA